MIFDEANFPEIPERWTSTIVDNPCVNLPLRQKILVRDYKQKGNLPIIDQGAKLIGGYIDDINKKVTDDLPVVVFGDHTRAIKYIDFKFAAGADGIKVLKPYGFFEPKLFYYFLRAIKLPNKGYSRHFQYLRKSRIAVPPLPEQKRIADKLDSLLQKVETCREHLERVPQIIERFRQSVLAEAVSGKLTEEWREKYGRHYDWQKAKLVDLGELGRGKSKHRPRNDPRLYGGLFPFIQTGAIAQS